MLLVVVVILSHLRWFGTHQATKPIDPRRCSSLSLSPAPLSCSSQFFNFPHRRCESFPESFLIVRWLDGAFLGTPQTDRSTQVQQLSVPSLLPSHRTHATFSTLNIHGH